jgi:nucleoside-diphosphate-sugar epimerase
MRVLIIGGTRFIGPAVVKQLLGLGHHVIAYHRSNYAPQAGAEQILAPKDIGAADDRFNLRSFIAEFRRARPDVVVHMLAYVREDAEVFVEVFRGLAGRAVVPSSVDVYLAFGRVNHTEPGAPQATPLPEEAEKRHAPSIHGSGAEKRDVEKVVMSEAGLPCTVLRYPAVYGPGDYQYRFYSWHKRMLDKRPAIVLGRGEAGFKFTHGYVEDIGLATAMAVENMAVSGRTYNVGEAVTPTMRERLEVLCEVVGYRGRIVEAPDEMIPGGDGKPWANQDLESDTSRFRNEVGFAERTDLRMGLERTVEWQRDHPRTSSVDYAAEDVLISEYGTGS